MSGRVLEIAEYVLSNIMENVVGANIRNFSCVVIVGARFIMHKFSSFLRLVGLVANCNRSLRSRGLEWLEVGVPAGDSSMSIWCPC